MERQMIKQAISNAPFFIDFHEDEIDSILSICKIREVKSGYIIFSELSQANSLFLLNKGHIQMVFDNKTIVEITQGQIFGDWAIVNKNMRLATARSITNSQIIEIDARAIKEFQIDPKISYKFVYQIANTLVNRLMNRSQIASNILIEQGENQYTEFKSYLRYNSFKNDKDAAIELASLKTIAGFLNAQGGVLFIGVKDDGSILGTEKDGFENADKMMLHLHHLVTHRIGKEALNYVHVSAVELENKIILRVDCDASSQPVFITDGKEELFFVRIGNMTQSYNMKEMLEYVKHRF